MLQEREITVLPKPNTELGETPAQAIESNLCSSAVLGWIDGLLFSQEVGVRNSWGLFMILGLLGLFSALSPLGQSSCEFAKALWEKERLV